jgi:threonine aldolase
MDPRKDFRSDNVTGVAPEIMAAVAAANSGTAAAYGGDKATGRVERRLAELFETEVTVFPVPTGTAANALALSTMSPPYGAIYVHELSHVNVDECGGPELFTGGAKLVDLPGAGGKLTAAQLGAVLKKADPGDVHHAPPAAISLTQATECGTVYKPDEIAAIAGVARRHALKLHMDGSRFANAMAGLGCRPADVTWRAGVDALSFGATKNGAMAAEAVVFFDRALAATFGYRRKRAGHLFSKMRFLSAQLEAYLQDDLWLRLAGHANAMAARMAKGLAAVPGVSLAYPVEANEIFPVLPDPVMAGLQAEGFGFFRWSDGGEGSTIARLVTAFTTEAAAVDAFIAAAQRLAGETKAGARPRAAQ